MNKKKDLKIQLAEIFMAKAGRNGWDRCFHGTIKRGHDMNGNPVVYSKIKVKDGYIYAMASDQWKLGEMLDEMVIMVLDNGIHTHAGEFVTISNMKYFLN